jgi:hypothetical protein
MASAGGGERPCLDHRAQRNGQRAWVLEAKAVGAQKPLEHRHDRKPVLPVAALQRPGDIRKHEALTKPGSSSLSRALEFGPRGD